MTQKKRRTGRRCKLTPEVQNKIVAALKAGNYPHIAAEYAGIDRATFFRWLQRGRESKRGKFRDFCDAVKSAAPEAEVRSVAVIQGHANKSWQAAMAFLARRFPDRWGRKGHLKIDSKPERELAMLLDVSVQEIEDVVNTTALLTDGTE